MITGQYKSATTGEIKDYGSGFAETSRFDALTNFFVNKAPPATRSVIDVTRGRNFEGEVPTFSSILMQAGMPISIQNMIELAENPTIDAAFGVVADFFGLGSNTFRDSNHKTEIIPTNTVIKNEDFKTMVQVYAKAIGTDPETAFNRIFTGQVIMQVSDGGIIVVERQDIKDSQAFKKQWVEDHGGKTADMKQIKLDHIIPNKLGGEEKPDNWQIVPNSVWSSYTKVENALIQAVKDKKISLKEAQKQIVEFKKIDDNQDRKERGDEIIDSFKKETSKKIVKEVHAAESAPKNIKFTEEEKTEWERLNDKANKMEDTLNKGSLKSPVDRRETLKEIKKIRLEQGGMVRETKKLSKGVATWYSPLDATQTKENPDGKGAYGRKIDYGSVAFGNRKFQDRLKKGEEIFIKVDGFENVETPYGMGVFRIDDTMNKRFDIPNMYKIDFYEGDMDQIKEKTGKAGKFNIRFRVIDNH